MTDEDHWQVFTGMNEPALATKNNSTATSGLTVDKKNHVWVNSFSAVAEYDGSAWKKYDSANSPVRFVQAVYADRFGRIWFSTFVGLIRYDGKDWKTYSTANSPIASNEIRAVFVDKNDVLWVATDKGINKLSNDSWTFISNQDGQFPQDGVFCINGDENGTIWAGAGAASGQLLVKIDTAGSITRFPACAIMHITIDTKPDLIWLATPDHGLVRFDGTKLESFNSQNTLIPGGTVTDMLIDRNGNKWISTFGGIVYTNYR